MPKKLTTEEFIAKAKEVHGGTYSYSATVYTGNSYKVNIKCNLHGEFTQKANSHLNGRGCPKCGLLKRAESRSLGSSLFVIKATAVHGQRYDYKDVVYRSNNSNVEIICPSHGKFTQTPTSHLRGANCPKCAASRRADNKTLTTEMFIHKARAVHGEKYTYEAAHYTGTYEKIVITCVKHGEFHQAPNSHLNGNGCPKCATVISKGHAEVGEFLKEILK
jgi:hypothetical protein